MMRVVQTSMMAIAAAILIPGSIHAQDMPIPYDGAVAEQGQRQLSDVLAKRRLQQARQRQTGGTAGISAKTRATCRDRAGYATRFGRDHPQVKRLYALCAQAGL